MGLRFCLHFAYYNFCRIHRTFRVTPAMAAGITDCIWDLSVLLTQKSNLNTFRAVPRFHCAYVAALVKAFTV